MRYVGISRYTEKNIEALLELSPDGVVLGDLLCSRKMFPYGGAELNDIIKSFRQKGLSVIYQTPMYVTDRRFYDVLQQVVYLREMKLIDAVIVQDIGLASALSQRYDGFAVIWGTMGYARTPIINGSTLDFYMKHGVNAFECKNEEQARYAEKIGAKAFLVYGYPKYMTVNRECYYRFEYNVFEPDCGLGCLKHEKMLLKTNANVETTIDGYTVGWQYIYDEGIIKAAESDFIIYAESPQEAALRFNEIVP